MDREDDFEAMQMENPVISVTGRVFEVLEFFREMRRPLSVREIAERFDYPLSSTSVLIKSIAELGYLSYDSHVRSYSMTIRVAMLATGSMSRPLAAAKSWWKLLGFLVLVACAALSASLLTWSAADPSLTRATSGAARNLLGPPGAILSDMLIQMLGLAGVFVLLPPLFWALRLLTSEQPPGLRGKLVLAPLAVLFLAGALSSLPSASSWPLHHGYGGVLGDLGLGLLGELGLPRQCRSLVRRGGAVLLRCRADGADEQPRPDKGGAEADLPCRAPQPNHPTDDRRGIAASIVDGLMLGCGDAVIGVNPAGDNVTTIIDLLSMLDDIIRRFEIPTQSCVLTRLRPRSRRSTAEPRSIVVFQSIGGTEAVNTSFGVTLALLKEAREAALGLKRGSIGDNVMYFETGQGSALSA